MAGNKDRATTKHIQRLLESVNARGGHLTAGQLDRFMRNPDGPIIPDDCLEVRRAPEAFGASPFEECAYTAFTVSPKGEPCFLARKGGALVTVCGDHIFALPGAPDPARRRFGRAIIGFTPDGLPITHLRDDGPSDEATSDADTPCDAERCYRGSECFLKGRGLGRLAVLHNGFVLHAHHEGESLLDGSTVIHLNDTPFQTIAASLPIKLFVASNGEFYGIWRERSGSTVTGRIGSTEVMVLGRFGHESDIPREIVETTDGIGVLVEDHDSHPSLYTIDGSTCLRDHIGQPACHRGYIELPDGRIVYLTIGRSHGGKPWEPCEAIVVNGVQREQFDHVSPCFRDADGEWRYWTALGGMLCRMRVPTPTADEIAEAAAKKPWHYPRE